MKSGASGLAIGVCSAVVAVALPPHVQAAGPARHRSKADARPALRQRPVSADPRYAPPSLPFEDDLGTPEAPPTTTLADAIDRAYRTNPTLGAQRYELRATDETLAQALAQLRPTVQVEVNGGYSHTDTGRITEATRPIADRLRSPGNFATNDLATQLTIDQPLSTGGRASASISAAEADIRSGREALRGVEGDLLTQVITAYADVRRDTLIVDIRQRGVRVLQSILDEIVARREAGELTRTDIAQAETQLAQGRSLLSAAEGQLQQSRTSFAALVGIEPGRLAKEPPLPLLPRTIDEGLAAAVRFNPDLAQAVYAEQGSRARIAAARAEARPSLSLRGTVGTTGQLVPFYGYNQDRSYSGRVVLTIPISQGGRVGSQVAQAADRNAADRLRIEAARRQMVQNIVNAWNQIVTSQRTEGEQRFQLEAAKVYYEGTFQEYRAGLRSTFDVLFAQNSLRDTQVALLASQRDIYVAQATLLRQIGLLEIAKLATGTAVYQPAIHVRQVEHRSSLPWDGGIRVLDGLGRPSARQILPEQPAPSPATLRLAPGEAQSVDRPLVVTTPAAPLPGTSGAPQTGPRR